MRPDTRNDLAGLLDLATRVAREAGRVAVTGREAALTRAVDAKTSPTDPVTAMDRAVERMVLDALLAARPHDAVLGEEGSRVDGGSGVRWVVDPIDGTVNYLYGIGQYAVSLAAEIDGVVMVGVVHNPATGEEYTAVRGRGAWRGRQRLHGSRTTELDLALIGTGFGYGAARRAHQATVLAALLPEVRDIRRMGSAALDLCFAAEGRFDAFFEQELRPWDRAAGALVCEEAGLLVTGLDGAPPSEAMTLAAPPALHGLLQDRLRDLRAAD